MVRSILEYAAPVWCPVESRINPEAVSIIYPCSAWQHRYLHFATIWCQWLSWTGSVTVTNSYASPLYTTAWWIVWTPSHWGVRSTWTEIDVGATSIWADEQMRLAFFYRVIQGTGVSGKFYLFGRTNEHLFQLN